jgi:hypothetical protein
MTSAINRVAFRGALLLFSLWICGCSSKAPTPAAGDARRIAAGEKFSGFLKDYSSLKANADVGGDALTYVHSDKMKSLRRYVAIIVDPVEIYVATNADDSRIPVRVREVVANYFRYSLVNAVNDAFPVVDTPGPLVLRLRSAIVGIDLGGDVAPYEGAGETFKRAIVLEKVGIEMELVDSQSGERIAALVDNERLGAGAHVGSMSFSREERFAEAKGAFDQWASRLRTFLNAAHELTGEDATRAKDAYVHYGQ